jgi:hypothetical protein
VTRLTVNQVTTGSSPVPHPNIFMLSDVARMIAGVVLGSHEPCGECKHEKYGHSISRGCLECGCKALNWAGIAEERRCDEAGAGTSG